MFTRRGVWQIVCDAVSAVHGGDPSAAHAATDRVARRVPFDSQPSFYVWWLLPYRVAEIVGHWPSAGELHQIAKALRPKVARVIRDSVNVENPRLTVWKLASEEQEMVSGLLLIGAVVALGVLLNEPREEMEAARPRLKRLSRSSARNPL